MKYRLICSDVDGTLIDENEQITEENLQAIRQLKQKGIYFAISSGRMMNSVKLLSEHYGITSYKVCSNGAVVVDECGEILQAIPVPMEVATRLYEIGKENDCIMGYNTLTEIVYNRQHHMEDSLYKRADYLYGGYDQETGEHYIKILCQEGYQVPDQHGVAYKISLWPRSQEHFDRVTEEIGKIPGICVTSAMKWHFEITAGNISKWSGIRFLMDYLHINREEVICIGDSMNDEAMVTGAGLGVCMENGHPDLKKKADYITGSHRESGVASVIWKCLDQEL